MKTKRKITLNQRKKSLTKQA